jgi:hypothetical protein
MSKNYIKYNLTQYELRENKNKVYKTTKTNKAPKKHMGVKKLS